MISGIAGVPYTFALSWESKPILTILQLDIVGEISGLLAAHPVAPLVTLHHLDIIHPIFPNTAAKNYTRVRALKHLLKAAEVETGSIAQQSICYAQNLKWSFTVSWGYIVQVHKGFVSPRELEVPQKTFKSWHKERSKVEFPFNTRDNPEDVCKQPTRFFMDSVRAPSADSDGVMKGIFMREFNEEKKDCAEKLQPLSAVQRIRVMRKKIDVDSWYQVLSFSCHFGSCISSYLAICGYHARKVSNLEQYIAKMLICF